MMTIQEQIGAFPRSPGVYLMRDAAGEILYVGKARDLRRRVQSYLRPAGDGRYQIRFLMERTSTVDYLVTDTEKEALILENTLIKRHRPRYNLNLRDDKTYFSLRIDPQEEFPRLTVVRTVQRDGARYFGPYASASAAREVLRQLSRLFPLRHYPLATCRRRGRPCLYHQLHQCAAPCHGLISGEDYAGLVQGVILFLEGRNREVVRTFRERMQAAAAAQAYEEAARHRDLLQAIEVTIERQKMVRGAGDMDVMGWHRDGTALTVVLLFVRGGSVIGSRSFALDWELDDAEGIGAFLLQFYSGEVTVPPEVVLPAAVAEEAGLAEFLADRRGGRVMLTVPQRGHRRELLELAAKNARLAAVEHREAAASADAVLAELQQRLHLPRLPRRIECYDISLMQGGEAVGSRVTFQDGVADKSGYRRYRIATVQGTDDFAMLREVLGRRFGREEAEVAPDLILVDGGTGQLNAVLAVLAELGLAELPTVSLAKSRVSRDARSDEVARSAERVFLPGRRNPVVLRQNGAPLLLLARVRDEAHRFAIEYHRNLRRKRTFSSVLDQIPGIGPAKRRALLQAFGSLAALGEASLAELCAVDGITPQLARLIQAKLPGELAGNGELAGGTGGSVS